MMHHVPNPNIERPYHQRPYNQRPCGIHITRNPHLNGACKRQQILPCPLPGHAHQASDCGQPRDYLHIPGVKIYINDSATARLRSMEVGEVMQQQSQRYQDDYDQPDPYRFGQQGLQPPVTYNTDGRYLPLTQQSANAHPPLYEPSKNLPIDQPSTSTSTAPRLNHIPAYETLPTPGNYLNYLDF